ncbi:hypothetical protein [Haloarcula brevis]|uniref:hypothetical protein n=1 Tax=Haloarcula brevis TaxID=3111453 RepID=UPI00300EE3BE
MDAPTFLELEVERDAVAAVLDTVPGVAVVDDGSAGSTPAPVSDEPDGPGLTDRLGSLWRQWGLLGTGLSLVALGAATAGLWWYRRRNGTDEGSDAYAAAWTSDAEDETPAPTGTTVDTPSPTETEFEPARADTDETPTPEPQETALASEATPTESEGWRRDTETDTEQSGAAGFEPSDEPADETDDEPADETDDERPEARINPAPLLGAAFLILSSALGRWATRDRDDRA